MCGGSTLRAAMFAVLDSRARVVGNPLGYALMLTGSLFEGMIGIEAAGQALKNVSKPLQNRSAGVATASRSEELPYAANCCYLSVRSPLARNRY